VSNTDEEMELKVALGIQLRIFDPQLCDSIDADWLKNAVAPVGITAGEVDGLINDGIVRRWKSPKGAEGFLIYSERQVRVAKALRDSGRYTTAELRHVFGDWNVMIEVCQADVLAYDDFDICDYEHFRRRSASDAKFFEEQLCRNSMAELPWMGEEQRERTYKQFAYWDRWHKITSSHEDQELEYKQRLGWRKALAHLRFIDEWTRMSSADNPGKLLDRGFSSEVTFDGHTESGAGTEFHDLNWSSTLQRFKETINEGHDFPLRTPAFTITRNGIIFAALPTPEELAGWEATYRLSELRRLLEKWGSSLWECDLAASGRAECAECRTPFQRTKASRKFCSDVCRNRSKARRYRENNPGKVDAARARYYK